MIGQTITARDGSHYTVLEYLYSGTQGSVYKVRNAKNQLMVLKQYAQLGSAEFIRAAELMRNPLPLDLPATLHRALVANGCIEGYITDFIDGLTLEDLVMQGTMDYFASVKIAAMLSAAVAKLHAAQLIHGDIQTKNVMVTTNRVILIDLDNFVFPKVKIPPPVVGEASVMAPELRLAIKNKVSAAPLISQASDVYALTILINLLVTGDDDSAGAQTPEEFNFARMSGRYNGDRFGSKKSRGLPPAMLPLQLESLIRQGLSGNPALRPAASEFATVFSKILLNQELILCEHCGQPVFIDESKFACPHCHNPFPAPALVLADGKLMVIDCAYRVIGRNDLGGDRAISSKHAVIARHGPLLRFVDRSSYGSQRDRGRGWEQINSGETVVLHPGEKIRMGNTQVQVGRA